MEEIANYFVNFCHSTTRGVDVKVPALRELAPSIWMYPSMRLAVEPTLFLAFLSGSGRCASPNTWKAAATDVEGWLNYLLAKNIGWMHAIIDDLIAYRDALLVVPSQKTGEPCAPATVRRRIIYIIEFYKYLQSKGLYRGSITAQRCHAIGRRSIVPSDYDFHTHIRAKARSRHSVDASFQLPHGRRNRHPKPLSVEDYRALVTAIGPRPSESEGKYSRDRLIVDLAITGGLRIDEIRRLRVDQVNTLDPNQDRKLFIRKIEGKGRGGKKIRDIEVHREVAKDILAYVDGERAQAVQIYKKSFGVTRAPDQLFYKHPSHSLCSPLSSDGIRAAFIAHQKRAKITEPSARGAQRHRYVFHDLRHTYASWTAAISVEKGLPVNWRAISAQLGHAHPSFTEKVYAHFVEVQHHGARTMIDLGTLFDADGGMP